MSFFPVTVGSVTKKDFGPLPRFKSVWNSNIHVFACDILVVTNYLLLKQYRSVTIENRRAAKRTATRSAQLFVFCRICVLSHLYFVVLCIVTFVFCLFVFCHICELSFCILSYLHSVFLHFVVFVFCPFAFCRICILSFCLVVFCHFCILSFCILSFFLSCVLTEL